MAFERRYAGTKMERRGQRGPNDAVGASYRSILGANLIAMWHSQLGIATVSGQVDTWTDQIQGIVVPAFSGATRPPYSPSASFGGKSVPVTSIAGTNSLRSAVDIATPLAVTGARPYLFSVFRRWQLTAATNQALFCLNGTDNLPRQEARDQTVNHSQIQCGINNATIASVATNDTLPHIVEGWADGTNQNAQLDGGSIVSTATVAGINANINRISIGGLGGGFTQYGDWEHALHLVCATYPGAAVTAALRAFAHADLSF